MSLNIGEWGAKVRFWCFWVILKFLKLRWGFLSRYAFSIYIFQDHDSSFWRSKSLTFMIEGCFSNHWHLSISRGAFLRSTTFSLSDATFWSKALSKIKIKPTSSITDLFSRSTQLFWYLTKSSRQQYQPHFQKQNQKTKYKKIYNHTPLPL